MCKYFFLFSSKNCTLNLQLYVSWSLGRYPSNLLSTIYGILYAYAIGLVGTTEQHNIIVSARWACNCHAPYTFSGGNMAPPSMPGISTPTKIAFLAWTEAFPCNKCALERSVSDPSLLLVWSGHLIQRCQRKQHVPSLLYSPKYAEYMVVFLVLFF